jgi:transposase-like protein
MADYKTWRKRVEGCEKSGLSTSAYARRIGVNEKTLSFWRWKIRKETPVAKRAPVKSRARGRGAGVVDASSFVELKPASVAPSPMFEVELRSGHRVKVPMSFDGHALGALVQALEVADATR